MENKIPPYSIEAEEAVIGSLLIGGDISGLSLIPSDFLCEALRWIYEAMLSLNDTATAINQVTVSEELERAGKLKKAGGSAYLSHCVSICPTHLDLEYYANIVGRLSVSRQLINVGGKISGLGYDAGVDINKTLACADDMLLEIRKRSAPSSIVTPKDRAELLMGRYDTLYNAGGTVAVETSLYDIDRALGGGFYNGDLVLLGARPSMGKTSLLQFIANRVGRDKKVLFCSGEMGIESLGDRDVAGLIGEPIWRVRTGNYTDELYGRIVGSIGGLAESNVYYYRDVPLTTSRILQAGTTMQLRHGLDFIVLDYIGMVDDDYGKNQYERIGYISRKLKQIAMTLNVPILAAHQLNRALEIRNDKRPELFDLRDSGRLEEDADVVLFIYREDYYFTAEEWAVEYPGGNNIYSTYPQGIVEVIVAKQRQGQSNMSIKVLYDKTRQVYQNLTMSQA